MYKYEYPRPAVAADLVIFGFDGKKLNLLLIQRKKDPYKGSWALPGGFVEEDETTEEGALRELQEETGLKTSEVSLAGVFSKPDRDPRGRVISISYYTLIRIPESGIAPNDDAEKAEWFPLEKLPSLAFDHTSIIDTAKSKLKEKICSKPVGLDILPEYFSISELHALYEAILEKSIKIRTFQRKLMKHNFIVSSDKIDVSRKRSAKLLQFNVNSYIEYEKSGFYLDLNEKE